jgi:hypothetical protein
MLHSPYIGVMEQIENYSPPERHLLNVMRRALPAPWPDTGEAYARRDQEAICQVAELRPVGINELALAVQFVAFQAEALECLSRARHSHWSPADVTRASSQARSMLRAAQSALGQLQRMQAMRERRAQEPGLAEQDRAVTEEVRARLTEALAAELVPPPPPPPEPEPAPEPEPGPITDELIHAANTYAELYPHRITFIRKHGGVPNFASFSLTDKELIHAILHADTPRLNALNPKPKVYPPDDPRSRHDFV